MRPLAAVLLLTVTTAALGQQQGLTPPPPPPLSGDQLPAPTLRTVTTFRPIFYTGIALLAVGYFGMAAWATAIAADETKFGGLPDSTTFLLYVPLVGPPIGHALFKSCRYCNYDFTNASPGRFLMMAASTSMQLTGLILFLVGLKGRSTVAVSDSPGLSFEPGAPGALLGLSVVFRH